METADTNRLRHVLVILLPNSPRALWGCYGSFANLTPHLDELAARGISLDRCILASPEYGDPSCSDWPQKLIAACAERQGVNISEVAIPTKSAEALVDLEEYQEEILDQILEAGEARKATATQLSLTVVRIPEVPVKMLPIPESEGEDDPDSEFEDGEFDDLDDDLEQDEKPPSEFPHSILQIEEQIDSERIVGWQDRFIPEVIAEWESTLEDSDRLVIVATERGCGFPFICDDEDSKSLESLYRIPCIVSDSSGLFAGTRIGALASVSDLPTMIAEWFTTSDLESSGAVPSWWSLLRYGVEELHQR
ncbi:MAG: hypothetical protein KDA36_06095, partial [Planctomycetaceae bacterium]|nr:hypothetical protein [Planctomycetaceae bacterium]